MVFKGKKLADYLLTALKKEIEQLGAKKKIKLASLILKNSPAYLSYQKSQKKVADYLGVDYQIYRYKNLSDKKLKKVIVDMNQDRSICGLLVEMPLPSSVKFQTVSLAIDYYKDIEGISVVNQGRLALGNPLFVSPTALACFYVIKTLIPRLYGKDVVIVGSSNVVGKPLAQLLLGQLATVSLVHIGTFKKGKLSYYTKQAEVLVVAAGKAGLIKKSMVKKGAVVIDVGINKKEGNIVGDVSPSAYSQCRYVTAVPGGIGPLTTAFLFSNLVKAYRWQRGIDVKA